MSYDIAIIGGGVVGCAVARELVVLPRTHGGRAHAGDGGVAAERDRHRLEHALRCGDGRGRTHDPRACDEAGGDGCQGDAGDAHGLDDQP